MKLRIVRRESPGPRCALGADLHPVLGRVYAARGVRTTADLDTSLVRLLPVGTLEGIPAAVELLLKHRAGGRVLIVGDFDADGATSSALMVRALHSLGFAAVDFLVPNRFQFGYGLTPEIVALAAERPPSLSGPADNGISGHARDPAARQRRIDAPTTAPPPPRTHRPAASLLRNPH